MPTYALSEGTRSNVVAAYSVAIEPLDFRDVSHAAIRTSCAEAALGEAEKLGKKHEPARAEPADSRSSHRRPAAYGQASLSCYSNGRLCAGGLIA